MPAVFGYNINTIKYLSKGYDKGQRRADRGALQRVPRFGESGSGDRADITFQPAPPKLHVRAHAFAPRQKCGKCQFVLVVYKHFEKRCPKRHVFFGVFFMFQAPRRAHSSEDIMYKKVDTSLNFVGREREVIEFWRKNDVFFLYARHKQAHFFSMYVTKRAVWSAFFQQILLLVYARRGGFMKAGEHFPPRARMYEYRQPQSGFFRRAGAATILRTVLRT